MENPILLLLMSATALRLGRSSLSIAGGVNEGYRLHLYFLLLAQRNARHGLASETATWKKHDHYFLI